MSAEAVHRLPMVGSLEFLALPRIQRDGFYIHLNVLNLFGAE